MIAGFHLMDIKGNALNRNNAAEAQSDIFISIIGPVVRPSAVT